MAVSHDNFYSLTESPGLDRRSSAGPAEKSTSYRFCIGVLSNSIRPSVSQVCYGRYGYDNGG